jgi:hypothetical protein
LLWPSKNLSSKFARDVLGLKYTVRHSMLNIRFGALPVTDVKIPHAPPVYVEQPVLASVRRSSQCGKTAWLNVACGRHAFENDDWLLTNCAVPFESRFSDVYT